MTLIYLILIFILSLIFCSTILRKFFEKDHGNRNHVLDAFRGILAPLVFLHHFILTLHWKSTGAWGFPENKLVSNLGSIPVSFFFMITGYLFLRKVTTQDISWRDLAVNRILRIYPLYLSFLFLAYLSYFYLYAGESPYYGIATSLKESLSFIIKPVNGFNLGRILGGVQWTLVYETIFYFSLPTLYIILNRKISSVSILCSIPFYLVLWYYEKNTFIINNLFFLFPIGAACFYLSKNKITKHLKSRVAGILVIISILTSFIATESYSAIQFALMGFVFLCVSSQNNILGILKAKGLLALGDISYSIYLIHGIILYYTFSVIEIQKIIPKNELYMYSVFPLLMVSVVAISCATYKLIEVPSIAVSHKIRNRYFK